MKGLVCGGRQFNDAEMLASRLIEIYRDRGITEIIEGAAAGVDTLARKFGEHKGIPVRTFPADWDRHGLAAGVKVLEVVIEAPGCEAGGYRVRAGGIRLRAP